MIIIEGKQLQFLGNVIQFPKNKEFYENKRYEDNKELKDKLKVAYKTLDLLTDYGCDFNIVLKRNMKGIDDILDLEAYKGACEYIIISSNSEEGQKLEIHSPIPGMRKGNAIVCHITGNEL